MSGAAVQSAMNAIAEQHHARWYFLSPGSSLVVWFGGGVVRALHRRALRSPGVSGRCKLRRPLTAGLAFSGIVVLLMAVYDGDPAPTRAARHHRALADLRARCLLSRLRALDHGQAPAPQHLLARPPARCGARRTRDADDPPRRRALPRTEDRPLVGALRRTRSGDGDPALALSPRAPDRCRGLPQRRALGAPRERSNGRGAASAPPSRAASSSPQRASRRTCRTRSRCCRTWP